VFTARLGSPFSRNISPPISQYLRSCEQIDERPDVVDGLQIANHGDGPLEVTVGDSRAETPPVLRFEFGRSQRVLRGPARCGDEFRVLGPVGGPNPNLGAPLQVGKAVGVPPDLDAADERAVSFGIDHVRFEVFEPHVAVPEGDGHAVLDAELRIKGAVGVGPVGVVETAGVFRDLDAGYRRQVELPLVPERERGVDGRVGAPTAGGTA